MTIDSLSSFDNLFAFHGSRHNEYRSLPYECINEDISSTENHSAVYVDKN